MEKPMVKQKEEKEEENELQGKVFERIILAYDTSLFNSFILLFDIDCWKLRTQTHSTAPRIKSVHIFPFAIGME